MEIDAPLFPRPPTLLEDIDPANRCAAFRRCWTGRYAVPPRRLQYLV